MSNEPSQPPPAEDTSMPDTTTAPSPQTYRQIATTHIATLSEISAQLPKLLVYFAALTSQLTASPIITTLSRDKPDTLRARQESIWVMTIYLGKVISEIRDELKQQIADLERYGVIPEKGVKFGGGGVGISGGEEGVRNGGYGEFDVGILNARVGVGEVGREDLVDRVRGVVEGLMGRSGVNGPLEGDHDMAVDG